MISLVVLLIVFLLIAVRRIGKFRFQIWQVMSLGAVIVLVTGQISPLEAVLSISPDVMLFLLGMFIVGEALQSSGYLAHLSYRLFRRARSLDGLVLTTFFGMGLLSAFLMNDTLAIIGTPVVLLLAKQTKTKPQILMLALAFSITIGSVMSPIGNPQNLLIAVNGNIANPFITFFRYLLLPTLINLFLGYLVIRLFYRKHFDGQAVEQSPVTINDPVLARLARLSLIILVLLIVVKITLVFAGVGVDFRLTYIALAAALPVIVFSRRRLSVIRKIDWSTLLFFAAMFVLMQSVWNSGYMQSFIDATGFNLASVGVIMALSIVMSQFISNVPLVALYLPILMNPGVDAKQLMALAAGSTIAGSLTVLGAASNVIIIQNAEQKYHETLTFWEFVRVGLPLTVISSLVYWAFLAVF